MRRVAFLPVLLLLASSARGEEPFRLDAALGVTPRVSISLEHRIRYEALNNQFRVGRDGDDDILMLRTLLHVRVRLGRGWTVGAEIEDSRTYLDDPSTPVTTSDVNASEILQAYAELDHAIFGGQGLLRVGRVTMDVGSRRFVARNRFRNTINGFSGIDWHWKSDAGSTLRAFYTLPLRRRPSDSDLLRHNAVQLDKESFDVQFWGLHGSRALPWGGGRDRAELYVFGLHEEKDAGGTRNRDLYTPGFRILRPPKPGAFDYETETAFQFGTSRTSQYGKDLDAFAHFHHLEVGYTVDGPWTPRLALQYDYASGDEDPFNDKNQSFDTLYGARRFDFGPTSIYGPFARVNINTPGVRLQVKPCSRVSSFVAFRAFWLASDRAPWSPAGVVDTSGDSGSYIGSQIEWRLRWEIKPGNVAFETGVAHLFNGKFIHDAPNSNDQNDSTYAYTALTFRM